MASFFEGISIHGISAVVSVVTLQGGCPFSGFTPVVGVFLAHVSVHSALLNLTLVTIERYVGVIHSLRYYVMLPPRRMVKLVAAVWITNLVLNVPNLLDNTSQIPQTITTFIFSLTLAITSFYNLKIYRVSRRQLNVGKLWHKLRLFAKSQMKINNDFEAQERFSLVLQLFSFVSFQL